MDERLIQRTVFPADRPRQALYCRFGGDRGLAEPEFPDRFSAQLWRGAVLSTDTYFNSFFEGHWRRHTRLGGLRLRLLLAGAGTARLVRRGPLCGEVVLAARNFEGEAEVCFDIPPPALHPRQAGLLHFEVVARSEQLLLRRADWLAVAAEPDPVRLVVGCCTFNRAADVLANVRAVLDDPGPAASVEFVVVVDQGGRKVRHHPDHAASAARYRRKFRLVEQDNFGGSGGFTRAILEASASPTATHVLLLDDDVLLEPESVFRAAAFCSLARGDLALGAPTLDRLRPLEIHDAGGRLDLAWLRHSTPVRGWPVDDPASLERLRDLPATHYNPWCFFAFPLSLLPRLGHPLPLFIRGDDAEFGYRLLRAGVPTVTLPGLGVWHEPFYLKKGGWHAYYDLRNMLALAAVHAPQPGWQLAAAFLQRLGHRLLLGDYAHAALLCEAVADFCRGPALLEAHPEGIHRKVVALWQSRPAERLPRTEPLPPADPVPPPRSRLARALHLLRCLLRQLRRSPAAAQPRAVLADADARWDSLGLRDAVAVDGWDPHHYQVVRRSRAEFLRLGARGLWLACQLAWGGRRLADCWRGAFARLTSAEFWRRYLGLRPATPARAGRRAA